ncbi:apolipoprotein N-acyltransferase, partial [Escherichia coli]|nr:apolipoprotein N-acyltransferase [Escherichia coli]
MGLDDSNFGTVMFSVVLGLALGKRNWRTLAVVVVLLPVPIRIRYSQWFTQQPEKTSQVSMGQGDIPQSLKWNGDVLL